jgi:hypothetical protein
MLSAYFKQDVADVQMMFMYLSPVIIPLNGTKAHKGAEV